jgi:aldehyde:ferredoxin oxidoreductase
MAEKIASREGFGDILADGVKLAAEKIGNGAEKFAIHIKGQELPMHDPRAQIRLGLGATYKAAP